MEMPTDRNYQFPKTRNVGFRNPQRRKETLCEDVSTMQVSANAAVVSPAISLAVSLNNGREQSTTETKSSQSSNQSGGDSAAHKPNCYQCVHRRNLSGSAHSSCNAMKEAGAVAGLVFLTGNSEMKAGRFHVRANTHGVRSGWFNWPMNYDPAWLIECSMFEKSSG